MWDGHLGRIDVAKPWIAFLIDGVRSGHSALYRARSTVRKFSAAEIEQMINDGMIEPSPTERATPILFALKNWLFSPFRRLREITCRRHP